MVDLTEDTTETQHEETGSGPGSIKDQNNRLAEALLSASARHGSTSVAEGSTLKTQVRRTFFLLRGHSSCIHVREAFRCFLHILLLSFSSTFCCSWYVWGDTVCLLVLNSFDKRNKFIECMPVKL